MQSGAVYQGVLKAVSPKLSIALALAHDKTKVASKENTEKLMQLEFADIVTVSVLPDSNPSKGQYHQVLDFDKIDVLQCLLCRYF